MSVRRTVVALVGAGLLVSGCSDDPEPRFRPTDPPSPTEATTTAEPEAQSPEEFIREWFEVGTEMQNTGETDAFRAMTPGCEPCENLAERVTQYYANGGFIQIESQEVSQVRPLSRREFSVMVNAATTTYKESVDSKRVTLPGGRNEFRVFLRQSGRGWLVTDFLDTPS